MRQRWIIRRRQPTSTGRSPVDLQGMLNEVLGMTPTVVVSQHNCARCRLSTSLNIPLRVYDSHKTCHLATASVCCATPCHLRLGLDDSAAADKLCIERVRTVMERFEQWATIFPHTYCATTTLEAELARRWVAWEARASTSGVSVCRGWRVRRARRGTHRQTWVFLCHRSPSSSVVLTQRNQALSAE